jgi:uncharacterized small protein (DUF1192 family)
MPVLSAGVQIGNKSASKADQPNQQRTTGIRTGLERLMLRCVQELGTLVVALEHHIERQIAQAREREPWAWNEQISFTNSCGFVDGQ